MDDEEKEIHEESGQPLALPLLCAPYRGPRTLELLPKLHESLKIEELQQIEKMAEHLREKSSQVPWWEFVAGSRIHTQDERAKKILFHRSFPSITNRKDQGSREQQLSHVSWIMADLKVQDQVKKGLPPTTDFIVELNNILGNSLRTIDLKGYSGFDPEDLPLYLQDLPQWINELSRCTPPFVGACALAAQLIAVHPFSNANGRTSRLILDMALELLGYPPCCFADKFSALISRSTSNWDIPLFEAIQKVLCASENTLRIIAGDDPVSYV